jgi:methionyl-tRNA formyltransferase
LSELGAEALVETLALLEAGALEEEEQIHSRATFAPKLNRDMARIDWARSAQELDWHLRGLDSVPGAWAILQGSPVKVFSPTPEMRTRVFW